MNFQELINETILKLKSDSSIKVLHFDYYFEELDDNLIFQEYKDLENKFAVDFYEKMFRIHRFLGNINVAWQFEINNNELISGEINLNDFYSIFFKDYVLYDDTTSQEIKIFLKELKPFDDHPFFGDGKLSAFRIIPKKSQPEIWFYDGSIGGQTFKLNLSIEEYFNHLFKLRGVINWQYLFCDIDLNNIDFSLQRKYLKQIVDSLPTIFPNTDFSFYLEIYKNKSSSSD